MKKTTILLIVLALVFSTTFFNNAFLLNEDDMEAITGRGGKGSSGGSGSVYEPPADPDGLTSWEFYDKFVEDSFYYWNEVEHSPYGNGYTDTNNSGNPDVHDGSVIIETLNNMGYDVPETTIDGLYYNYYTEAGYDIRNEDQHTKDDFRYTKSNLTDEEDLKDGDYWKLDKGDLIFIDYNQDFVWNNAAIYMGWYGGYSNAALIANDYYGTVQVVDLDYDNVINMDIAYGYSDSRTLDYYNIEKYF
ncbi:MAG: hypothetical protein ACQESP_03600 [Candidatus Muiribacteriota bacterium]